jgi:copper(I)-binding protein
MRKLILTLAVLTPIAAQAQTPASSITVENAWSRATPAAAKTGALYLTIIDHGAPDRLISVATPVADTAELHQTTMQNGIMRMRPVDGLAVSEQEPGKLAPGGYHIMLMGLKQQLKPGASFPVTLTFEHAGAVQASAVVAKAGASAPGAAAIGHMMDGSMMGMDMSKPMAPAKKP